MNWVPYPEITLDYLTIGVSNVDSGNDPYHLYSFIACAGKST
jgi:hypothetical protein